MPFFKLGVWSSDRLSSRSPLLFKKVLHYGWILWHSLNIMSQGIRLFWKSSDKISSLRFFRFANPDCGKDCIFRSRRNLASKFAQIWLQASHYTRAVEKNHREQSLWTSESEDECNKMEQIYNLIHRRCNTVPLSQKFWSNRPESA